MATTKPVPLCTLVKPDRVPCRAIALRNQRFCRSHSATHREYERDKRILPGLQRLAAEVEQMKTGDLLSLLQQKLNRLPKTIHRFPDVAFVLAAARDRMQEITRMESNLEKQIQQSHILLTEIQHERAKSNPCSQNIQNHIDTPLS